LVLEGLLVHLVTMLALLEAHQVLVPLWFLLVVAVVELETFLLVELEV
jgi:hypothetical protein